MLWEFRVQGTKALDDPKSGTRRCSREPQSTKPPKSNPTFRKPGPQKLKTKTDLEVANNKTNKKKIVILIHIILVIITIRCRDQIDFTENTG